MYPWIRQLIYFEELTEVFPLELKRLVNVLKTTTMEWRKLFKVIKLQFTSKNSDNKSQIPFHYKQL